MADLDTKRRPQSKRTKEKRISAILRDMDRQTECLEQIIEAQDDIEDNLTDVCEAFHKLKQSFQPEIPKSWYWTN